MKAPKDTGLRMTPQRAAILEYLDGNRSHPSADEIFRSVRKKYPMISFATVYNTLEALKEKGSVMELTIDPRRRRYDPNTNPHHHLICVRCRKVIDIQEEYGLDIPDASKRGFEVMGNHIEFYGICSDCAAIDRRKEVK